MSEPRLDVIGVGNAIVDVLSHAEDGFLETHGLDKGTMTLVDEDGIHALYRDVGPAVECSGGSAANTIAGLSGLGAKCAFVGKVKEDTLGGIFRHDIQASGVEFNTPSASDGPATATCLVLVTPDAQRTMVTYLGASVHITADDVDAAPIDAAQVTYLEGYLWDRPEAKAAFRRAAERAHAADRLVALSLSDPFCVDRHRADFLDLVEGSVDLLFANEDEIVSLYEAGTFDEALQHVRGHTKVAALTRSEKGAVIVSGDEVHVIDAVPGVEVVDTTGAGDAFAGGFLAGFTGGKDLGTCGRMGTILAAEVISRMGARSDRDLKAVMAEKLT